MTTRREKRCRHCKVRYSFKSSGPGCHNLINDDRYCPQCKGAILLTLIKTPMQVKLEWEVVSEPTVEMCKTWEKEWEAEHDAHDPPYLIPFCRRIACCLYDMKDSDNHNYVGIVEGRGEFQGKMFMFSTWSKKPEKNQVNVAIERHRQTGEKVFWRDL